VTFSCHVFIPFCSSLAFFTVCSTNCDAVVMQFTSASCVFLFVLSERSLCACLRARDQVNYTEKHKRMVRFQFIHFWNRTILLCMPCTLWNVLTRCITLRTNWLVDFVHRPDKILKYNINVTTFRKLVLLPSSVVGRGNTNSDGSF
jgi:hypothetical protein